MREIVLDTETTGMEPSEGHRLIEIGCVELLNHLPTGRTFHKYLNPERDVPAEAVAVHGLTAEFLRDKPVFSEVFADFLEFIGEDSILVIHNAEFDMKFLNAELRQVGHGGFPAKKALDTVMMARKKFPGSPASLDALCRRFGIDNSNRTLHGALLDAQLLSEVYLELKGGRQHGLLELAAAPETPSPGAPVADIVSVQSVRTRIKRAPRPHEATESEREAHRAMLAQLTDAMWLDAEKEEAPVKETAAAG